MDNEQALRQATMSIPTPPQPASLANESDIIDDIQQIYMEFKITFLGSHVKSHQEENTEAPLEVLLNEECDKMAKQLTQEMAREERRHSAMRAPTDTATLVLLGRVVTNNVRSRLHFAATSGDMRDYLSTRHHLSGASLDGIDWEHLEIGLTKVFKTSRPRFSRLVKFIHDIH